MLFSRDCSYIADGLQARHRIKAFRFRDLTGMKTGRLEMSEIWTLSTRRQAIPVQRETDGIFLRAADQRAHPEQNINDAQSCMTTRQASRCPAMMSFLEQFSRLKRGSLQRVLLVRLRPWGQVYPNIWFLRVLRAAGYRGAKRRLCVRVRFGGFRTRSCTQRGTTPINGGFI
jgi:hypothetical protein